MKSGKLLAVLALVLSLCLPMFGQLSPGSLAVNHSGGNGGLRDGHSQGRSKPTHPKSVRPKRHKGTKHKNPHKRVHH
jgi:hypothetical protein